MAVSRKPKSSPSVASSEAEIEALINRGGSPTGSVAAGERKSTPILLRIPDDIMQQLDVVLKARPVRLPRHTWILEAIHEKLTRELPPKS